MPLSLRVKAQDQELGWGDREAWGGESDWADEAGQMAQLMKVLQMLRKLGFILSVTRS